MPSKRCIQGLVETRLTKNQFEALDKTFRVVMRLTFEHAKEEAAQRANGGLIRITPQDVRKALKELGIR